MTAFRHRYATRLNSFRATGAGVAEALWRAAAVPGIVAAELNYPEHFEREPAVLDATREAGLAVSALNLRYDPGRFRLGAFTNPDPNVREQALAVTRDAVDLAAANAIPHVILWMGPDGFDYPAQADYADLWDLEIAGFREIAERRPEVRVSVEPKPSDPRRCSVIRGTADALLAAHEVNRPNFGVTLDVCHSLMAGETPAAAAALALRAGRLFGLHLNDGYGPADDGLMVGSVHPQQTLDLLWTLRRHGYDGTVYFDTFPDRLDPAVECAANIAEVERLERLLDRIDLDALGAVQRAQNAAAALALIRDAGAT